MQNKDYYNSNKFITFVWSLLLLVLAIFLLTLMVKVGTDLVKVFQVIPVEAASDNEIPLPAAPTATPVSPGVAVTSPPPTTTPPPPTSTPVPTSSPVPTSIPEQPHLVAGESGVNVRSGPGLVYEKIGLLIPGSKVEILGYNGDWWAVDLNGEQGWVYGEIVTAIAAQDVDELTVPPTSIPDPTSTPIVEETPLPVWTLDENHWIDVDLSEQRLTAYEKQTPVKSYLVSTGLPQTPTPVGQYRIWIKLKTDDMAGADYYIKDVPWVMYFHEGYGLHGVTWHANFGHQMSHGCVNQPNDMAEWLFNFSSVGTLVNVHE